MKLTIKLFFYPLLENELYNILYDLPLYRTSSNLIGYVWEHRILCSTLIEYSTKTTQNAYPLSPINEF